MEPLPVKEVSLLKDKRPWTQFTLEEIGKDRYELFLSSDALMGSRLVVNQKDLHYLLDQIIIYLQKGQTFS